MNFFITSETSYEITTPDTVEFENQLYRYFESKNYGEAINKISAIVICVSDKFEPLHPIRKPKVSKNKLSFEYKLDFDLYKGMNEEQRKRYIAAEYFENIKKIFEKKKIKDFDSDSFLKDLEIRFKEQGLLL